MITEVVTKPELKLSTGGDGRWRIQLRDVTMRLLADLTAEVIEDQGTVVVLRAAGPAVAAGEMYWGFVCMPDGTRLAPARCKEGLNADPDAINTLYWNGGLQVIPGSSLNMPSVRVAWNAGA